jgi:hypothetical protein
MRARDLGVVPGLLLVLVCGAVGGWHGAAAADARPDAAAREAQRAAAWDATGRILRGRSEGPDWHVRATWYRTHTGSEAFEKLRGLGLLGAPRQAASRRC